jgi:DNA-directed RNA polymerase subunit L
MMNKPLSNKEKQFTILPSEEDPKKSLGKANQAISKALSEIEKTRNNKPRK